jgi:hypothetical protein
VTQWRRPAIWVTLLIAAAAAATVAIAVVVEREPPVVAPGGAVRGGDLVAATPAGPIAAVGEFTWMSPYGRTEYRVTVVDAAGAVRFITYTSQERVTMPRNQAARLAPGRYSWKVEAFDEQRRSLGGSRAQPFEILPPR